MATLATITLALVLAGSLFLLLTLAIYHRQTSALDPARARAVRSRMWVWAAVALVSLLWLLRILEG